jgi:tetratricopeptide (TPR) repeat protein
MTMRRLVFSLGLILAAAVPAVGQVSSAVQAFDEGNRLYRDGRYADAIDAYETALARGYTSGALYYNLGNAHFRLDRIGQAIRYYEKSLRFIPDSPELRHGLDIARSRTVDQFSHVPRPAWIEAWHTFTDRNAGRWLFAIGFVVYLAGIGLFTWQVLRPSTSPWWRRARALASLAALILLGAGLTASVQAARQQRAVLIASEAPLKMAPTPEAGTESTIHEGVVVDVLETSDGWSEISLPNGATGWVEAATLGDI